MKSKMLAAVLAVPMLVGSLMATTAAAGAVTTVASDQQRGTASLDLNRAPIPGFWYTAQENYFYSLASCNAWGYGATNNGNGPGNGYISGTTNWQCYVNLGDPKWSIDLYMAG